MLCCCKVLDWSCKLFQLLWISENFLPTPRFEVWGRVSGSGSGIPPRWQLRWGQKLFTSVAKNEVSCWQSGDESLWFWVKGWDLAFTAAGFYFQFCPRFRCLSLLSLLLRKQGGIQVSHPGWVSTVELGVRISPWLSQSILFLTPSILLQNYVYFLYQCPLALAVFFLCLPYTASFRLQPVRSPLGGEEELWMLPTALEPGGLQLLPHFMKGFLLNFRCQIRLENHRNVKVLNVAVPFLLKSSKPVIILKVKCWWRVLKLCQECSPLAP